jgi:Methyltransferase domain
MSPKLVNLILRNIKILEVLALPATFLIGVYMMFFTRVPPIYLRRSYRWFTKCNWLPVMFHYYQPVVKLDMLPKNYDHIENHLVGIDLNIENQLDLLSKFDYNEELEGISKNKTNETAPYYSNINFQYGDAEILYNMIRHFKPKRIIEIGSGESTKFVQLAIEQNKQETASETQHTCIEPFEQLLPKGLPLTIIRERVEHLGLSIFGNLSENDILFIDSSHVIRAGGDVLFEYLNIIPSLHKGVIVHCHDIFLPREYPLNWLDGWKRFWNEQYLLQALLSYSPRYQVLLSLNFLTHHYVQNIEECCPAFKREKQNAKEPSSFWFQVVQ